MENKKKIAVLTYPIKHRKTFDILSLLKANGFCDVNVFSVPFSYQKKSFPIINHRPEMSYNIPDVSQLCTNFGYNYKLGKINEFNIESDRLILIAGAGLLPEDFVNQHIIINSHPGYIPNTRGLDSYKWAIIDKQPIGVTTHLVGKFIDAGNIIERRLLKVNKYDTFHSLAQRVYENEVSMIIEAINNCDNTFYIEPPKDSIVHKRMPKYIEKELFKEFDKYKLIFAEDINDSNYARIITHNDFVK